MQARNKEACGHFIFQGPPGVGKRTMIWAMIREAFGPDCIQVCYIVIWNCALSGEILLLLFFIFSC